MLKKNILNPKDKNKYSLSKKRIIIATIVLLIFLFIIMYIYGGIIDKNL